MKNIFTAIVATSLLSSCATIFSGTTQDINVKVVDSMSNELLTDVNCKLTDPNGGMYVTHSNPATVMVNRGHGTINIDCSKPGYTQLNFAVGNSFNAVTIVNVLFWPGFIVDAASGSMKKYPSHYVVSMKKN